jgi:hypothetical protein
VYSNGYPTSYGNALTLGGAGGGELLIGWSGSTGAHADNYVRSRRDTGNTWSAWAKLISDVNINSYAPTLTGGGASGTWGINITGNAVTVSAITSTQVTNALGYTPVNPSTLTNQSGTAGNFSSITATTGNFTTLNFTGTLLTGVGNLSPNYDLLDTNAIEIGDAHEYLKLEAAVATTNNWSSYAWLKGNWSSSGGLFGIEGNAINALRVAVGLDPTDSGDTIFLGNTTSAGLFYNGLMISENQVILKGKNIKIDSEDGVAISVNASIQANIIGNVTGSAGTVTTISSAQIVTALGYTPVNPSVLTNTAGSAGNFSTIAASGDITITKSQPTIFFNDSGDGGIELAIRVNSSEGLIIYEPEDGDSQWFRIDDNSNTGYLWESQILTAANYTTFAPGKTGTGASGTWAINVTGNAGTVTTITSGQITGALGYTPANGSGAGLINGEQNYQDFNLKRATIIDYSLAHNALGNVSGSTSLNMEVGNYVSATAVGAVTWSFTNPPTSSSGVASRAGSIILELTNGGAYTQYWPAATRWPAGTAPSLTSSGVDVLVFITDDAGTNWRGAISMSDSR